ncbi:MAG: glycosyltransferase family 2 protein [Pygmaiobacter sp.]
MQKNYQVSASMVTYCGAEEAAAGVRSLLAHSEGCELAFYVIDNASPDGAGAMLAREFDKDARVEVLCLPTNIGFGSGHNTVLGRLSSEYHVVLNPDITVDSDVLAQLCRYLDAHPDVVMVTPQLRFPDGSAQNVAKRQPTFLALLARQLHLGILKKYEDHYLMLDEDLSMEQDVQFCSGCFFVMRTAVFQAIGGFDENYFMYVEDADLTRKALQQGRVVYQPACYVYHAWHRTTKRSAKHFWMQVHSMGRYFKKWGFQLK